MKRNIFQNIVTAAVCLLFSSDVFPQTDVSAGHLAQQFNTYQLHNFQEKIFVHTDKAFYLAGETMWFKIYDADEYFNKPCTLSSISYIELINNANHPVLQAAINMENGTGSGSVIIPPSLPSGHYLLRSYTNWMKNFDPGFYFQQPVSVINTLNKTSYTNARSEDSVFYDAQFFPEGGNLVNGLESKVGFKIVNADDEGVNASGVIIDRDNNIVSNFKTFRFGMGNFIFTPQKNNQYRAVIKTGGRQIIKSIPAAYDNGYVIRVFEMDTAEIEISVHSNISTGNPVYLFVQSHNLINDVRVKPLENGEVKFYIDKNKLADGVSQFTIFDAGKRPVCERIYFKKPQKILHINATAGKTGYAERNKVTLQINTTDINGTGVNANLSASVFQLDTLQHIPSLNISDYFMLVSDLKGSIESPEYYFENSGRDAGDAADNLMLTQGWRRFNWDDILKDTTPYFNYLPEMEGPLITGKIINKITNLPANNITGYLSVPGQVFSFATAISNKNGDILFNIKKIYGNKVLIIQTNNETDSIYRIEVNNFYADKFSDYTFPYFSVSKNLASLLIDKSINVQVENSFNLKEKRQYIQNISNDTLNFYGKPDWQYYLDNYTRFITMEEVLREYVADLLIKKKPGNYNFNLGDDDYKKYFDDNPLVLVDGVPVFDNNKVMNINPLKIKRLDIVPHKYYSGNLISNGIMSFATYNGDLAGYELDPKAVVLEYNGLQIQRQFYSPVYTEDNKVNDHLPDFRNVLSWMPEIKTGNNGTKEVSFYTSGITGTFAVIIEGLTAEGLCGYKILTFNVTANK